jgi:hypothetical protein
MRQRVAQSVVTRLGWYAILDASPASVSPPGKRAARGVLRGTGIQAVGVVLTLT